MSGKSFGRRGVAPMPSRVAAASVILAAEPPPADANDAGETVDDGVRLMAIFPILTAVMIVFLTLVFLAEKKFAPDIRGNMLSATSVIALGGASRDLVFGEGEWWRLFLAPIFHSSLSHLIGNCVALAFVGSRLEPLLGRWWMCATFVISALGGMVGSMIFNPPAITTVGASGAITGLVGALFMASFHNRADPDTQYAMRKTALWFGVPALAPLLWTAGGTTDYFAHLGGAIAGAGVALAITLFWDGRSFRPGHQRIAAAITLIALAICAVSAGMAATRFKDYAGRNSHLIPLAEMPSTTAEGADRANDFVARYPRDPRAHLFRAVALMKSDKLLSAELELKSVLATAHEAGQARKPLEQISKGYLALIYAYQGRRGDAQTMAKDVCGAGSDAGLKASLKKMKLCP
jgi:rhomboid protease GluP